MVQQIFLELWGPPPPKPDDANLFAEGWAEANPEEAIPTDDVKRYLNEDFKAASMLYDYRYSSYMAELRYYIDMARCSPTTFHHPAAEWVR